MSVLRRLLADLRAISVVEFAIIVPVLMTLLCGLGDLMYQAYVQSVLEGAVIKAGRDSSLEENNNDQAALDQVVRTMVGHLGGNMTFTSDRKSYASFSLVKPETFDDKNANGKRDAGECFDDVNNNAKWDADPGAAGQGGASDVTRYTMTVSYPRLFPMAGLLGWSDNGTATATTLLKNQPYRIQETGTVKSVCT